MSSLPPLSPLANVLTAVVQSPSVTDATAANVLAAAAGLDEDSNIAVRYGVASSAYVSATFVGAMLTDAEYDIRRVCYTRDDIDTDLVVAALDVENDFGSFQAAAASARPAVTHAVVQAIIKGRAIGPIRSREDQLIALCSILSNNERLDPADARLLVRWLPTSGLTLVDDDTSSLPGAFLRLAKSAFAADQELASQMLAGLDERTAFDLWIHTCPVLDDQLGDTAFRRVLVGPLSIGKGVSDLAHERLYRAHTRLTQSQRAVVVEILQGRNLSGCVRAPWIREEFLTTPEQLSARDTTATTTRDAGVLTRLFAAQKDVDSDFALLVALNPCCPKGLALRCLEHLSANDIDEVVGRFGDDIDWLASVIGYWPGIINHLTGDVRTQVAFESILNLQVPWDDESKRRAGFLSDDLGPDQYARLPMHAVAALTQTKPALAQWVAELIGCLSAPELALLARLDDRGDVSLSDLVDVILAV